MSIKNITVIGSGTMGNGIAHVCAQFGYQVSLVDIAQTALDKAIVTKRCYNGRSETTDPEKHTNIHFCEGLCRQQ